MMTPRDLAQRVVGRSVWSSLSEKARIEKANIVEKFILEHEGEIARKMGVMIEAVDKLTCEDVD